MRFGIREMVVVDDGHRWRKGMMTKQRCLGGWLCRYRGVRRASTPNSPTRTRWPSSPASTRPTGAPSRRTSSRYSSGQRVACPRCSTSESETKSKVAQYSFFFFFFVLAPFRFLSYSCAFRVLSCFFDTSFYSSV